MTRGVPAAVGRRSSRTPAFSYAAILVVMVVVLALFTFAPPPTSPPAIAEVAPKALEQITDAPVEQAVSAGGSVGSVGALSAPTTTLPPPPAEEEDEDEGDPTPFRCVGASARQIEDPQSPPCVPVFNGDNGGATYQGVTRDTITVAVPDFPGPEVFPTIKAFQDFFNTRFQFYGRKLKLVGVVDKQQTSGADEASAQQHLAAVVDDEVKAFASLSTQSYQGTTYYRELARRKVLAITNYSQYSQTMLEGLKPYVWQYGMALDRVMAVTGDWLCQRVAGAAADRTSDTTLLGDIRKLGLIYQDTPGNRLDITPLTQALKTCESGFAVTRHLAPEQTTETRPPYSEHPEVQAAVAEFKDQQVTSILCLCHTSIMGSVGQQATRQGYFPEWLVSTYLLHEVNHVQTTNNPDRQQRQGMFGISFVPRLLKAADDPAVWALQEGNPAAYQAANNDTSPQRQLVFHDTYRTLLLLASGIQLAGPNLTPETFARGLHQRAFPNPESPLQPGKVGFLGGSYSMTQDAAEFYWSNTAPSPYQADGPGTWCYLDGGGRRSGGDWPEGAFAAQTPCDSGR